VQVRDAETKEVIPGAQVRIWHPAVHSTSTSGTTGTDGVAHVPQPPTDSTPLNYELAANGYLPRQTDQPVERTASGVVVELYHGPRPTVDLVVPTGYRGVVKATVLVKDGTGKPGQRVFTESVPQSGVVQVAIPPIIGRGHTPDLRARYADGTPLPRDAKDYKVGCRWLKADEGEYVFVIGTTWECDAVRREMKKKER
jgi:hypothetical protein